MLGARPFDRCLMTPINATDMQQCCNPQYKPYIPSTCVQLRTPSSFVVKSPYTKYPYEMQNKQNVTAVNNNTSNANEYKCALANVSANSDIVRSQPIEGRFHDNSPYTSNIAPTNKTSITSKIVNSSIPAHLAEQEIVPARETYTCENYVPREEDISKNLLMHSEERRDTLNNTTPYFARSETANSEVVSIAESMLADAFLPPSAIHVNDIIGSTLDEKELMFIREKLTNKYNAIENPVVHAASKLSRSLDANDVLHPHGGGIKESNSPASINKEMDREAILSVARHPAGTSNVANVPAEAEKKVCKPLSHVESTIASADTNEGISDLSLHRYKAVDPTVFSSNSSSQTGLRYPVNANPLQAKLSSSVLQPTIIHSEQLQNQVFPHNVVSGDADESVQNVQYLKNAMEGLKVDSTKTQKCQKCHEDIRVGDVAVIMENASNASWHPGCFVCSVCNELLADLVYFHYKSKLYCGRDLAAFLGIPRCFACDEVSPKCEDTNFFIAYI